MPFEMDSTISIHAPREGGRQKLKIATEQFCKISIHAPRKGGDDCPADHSASPEKFQSTPPRGGRRTGDAHANRDV